MSSPVFAVDTTRIDEVREKAVLDSGDFEVIDAYVDEAIGEFLRITDFSSVSIARNAIIARSRSATVSAEGQYAQQFFTSAAGRLEEAFEETRRINSKRRAELIRLNLMILLDNLEDIRLAEVAVKMLDDENAAVRYWAVHAVTNPAIAASINSDPVDNAELSGRIVRKLEDRLAKEKSPEIVSLIIDFAGNLKIPEAGELLLKIADNRIKKYESWTVDDELLDDTVLVLLCDAIVSQPQGKAEFARRFAQLYSYAIQMYIQAMDDPGLLDEEHKQRLASLLVDVESKCIGKLLDISQSTIRNAVERERSSALLAEHNSLFGSEENLGRLVRALDFDYGQNPDGSRRSIPLVLPPKP